MNIPSDILNNAIKHLSSLPGIGKRTALRLSLHLLNKNSNNIIEFGNAISDLINIKYCSSCYSISTREKCAICMDEKRDSSIVCVVEDIRTLIAIENTMQYKGKYHVLGGLISPIDGIGPNDININQLIKRVEKGNINELIFALSSTMEGDTTNFYLYKRLKDYNIILSSIARGVAIGDELEYTDQITLVTAINSRLPYENSLSKH